jgi:hypothetical protein
VYLHQAASRQVISVRPHLRNAALSRHRQPAVDPEPATWRPASGIPAVSSCFCCAGQALVLDINNRLGRLVKQDLKYMPNHINEMHQLVQVRHSQLGNLR